MSSSLLTHACTSSSFGKMRPFTTLDLPNAFEMGLQKGAE